MGDGDIPPSLSPPRCCDCERCQWLDRLSCYQYDRSLLEKEHYAIYSTVLAMEKMDESFATDDTIMTSDEQPLPYLVLRQMVLRQTKVLTAEVLMTEAKERADGMHIATED